MTDEQILYGFSALIKPEDRALLVLEAAERTTSDLDLWRVKADV